MKQIIILLCIVAVITSCDKFDSNEFKASDITIKVGTICGWCTLNDTLSINDRAIHYINYTECQNTTPTIDKSGTLSSKQLEDLLASFDANKFSELDLNSCNVCVDGCDDWIYFENKDFSHSIRFSRNDKQLDEIRDFIDLLFELKAEYAEN